jgi:hypothetical protein
MRCDEWSTLQNASESGKVMPVKERLNATNTSTPEKGRSKAELRPSPYQGLHILDDRTST